MPANVIKGLMDKSKKDKKTVEDSFEKAKNIYMDDSGKKEKDFQDKDWKIIYKISLNVLGIKESQEWIKSFLESGKSAKEYFREANIKKVKILSIDNVYGSKTGKEWVQVKVQDIKNNQTGVFSIEPEKIKKEIKKGDILDLDFDAIAKIGNNILYAKIIEALNETQISADTPSLNSEIIKPVTDKDEEEEIEKDEEGNSGIENGFDVPMFSTDMVESESKKKNLNNDIEKIDESIISNPLNALNIGKKVVKVEYGLSLNDENNEIQDIDGFTLYFDDGTTTYSHADFYNDPLKKEKIQILLDKGKLIVTDKLDMTYTLDNNNKKDYNKLQYKSARLVIENKELKDNKLFLKEAGFGSNVDKGIELVASQLGKKTGQSFDVSPMVETYSNSYGNYEAYNIVSKNRRVRFNIKMGDSTSQIESVDIWYSDLGNEKPQKSIDLLGLNILQVLDEIASLIENPLNESLLAENLTRQTKDRTPSMSITQLSKEAQALGLTELESPTKLIYQQLEDFVTLLGKGIFNGLIVTGDPGLGKTSLTRNTLNRGNRPFSVTKLNTESTIDFYKILYKNQENGKIIVFDEADLLIKKNTKFRTLMLSALETSGKRVLSYLTKRDPEIGKDKEYPMNFSYQGALVMISNLSEAKIEPAIKSRCLFIDIRLTKKEILDSIKEKLKNYNRKVDIKIKEIVFSYIFENRASLNSIDYRKFEQALNLYCVLGPRALLYIKNMLK